VKEVKGKNKGAGSRGGANRDKLSTDVRIKSPRETKRNMLHTHGTESKRQPISEEVRDVM